MFILEIIMMGIATLWIVVGVGVYRIWEEQAPGGGLFPVIGGSIVLICCVIDIMLRIMNKKPIMGKKYSGTDSSVSLQWIPRQIRPLAIMLYGFASLLVLKFFGFLPCSLLTCFIWLCFISKKPLLQSIITSIVTTSVLYGIFVAWLNISFPKGIF